MSLRILLSGADGAMGREIRASIDHSARYALAGVLGRDGAEPAPAADVLIDFSRPAQTLRCIAVAGESRLPLVIGTTGLGDAERDAARRLAETVPVCLAANFSTGIAVLRKLATDAARWLDEDYDIEITETHHRRKVDAPSGTALALAQAVAAARGQDPGSVLATDHAARNGPRAAGAIGIHALRGGDVAGEHSIFFLGEGERLELTHRAVRREIFARGALLAASLLVSKNNGLFDFHELIS